MKHGFFLKKLRAVGTNKPVAEVEFCKGLNVISGPSDTGKTYIFQCINFMLGGSNPPKDINESVGYERLYLELETHRGQVYTVTRNTSGGNFSRYDCGIEDIEAKTPSKVLKQKHNADGLNNISSFLLSLSGFKIGSLLKVNKKNKTRTVSFRDITRLILIDENRIIAEDSPILTQNKTSNTVEKSAFQLMITGTDNSGVTEKLDPKIRKARLEAKLEVINSLIEKIVTELKESNMKEKEKGLEYESNRFREALNMISNQIEEKTKTVKVIWQNIQELESRKSTIIELIKRFDLLREQYKADLKRLEFISEGNQYFSQLEYDSCPYCLQSIPNHDCAQDKESSSLKRYEGEEITRACQIEANKINLSLKDLEKTINDLKEEKNQIEKENILEKRKYGKGNEILIKKLQPKANEIKSDLDSLLKKEREMNKIVLRKEQLNDLELEKLVIQGGILKKQTKVEEEVSGSNTIADSIVKLNKTILDLLTTWNFPELINVQFDQVKYDFSLSNKPRSNFGKGIRAITFSAFTIGLMEYCQKDELPHPGFVVLDSPLTTFRDKDREDEEVNESMQESFFKNLSSANKQIIILENKEPTEEVKKQSNYIEFTNIPGKGREGFFKKN